MNTIANLDCKCLRPIKNHSEYQNLLVNLTPKKTVNKTVYIYNYLLNLCRWSERLKSFEFPFNRLDVLVPTNQDTTTIVVIVDRTDKFWPYCIWVYASQEDNGLLVDCLRNSKYIDWSKKTLLAAVHEFNLDSIKDLITTKECKILEQDICDMYTLEKNIALCYEYT